MLYSSRQRGFTLLEIMVVVFILATMAGLSLFAINQASDRRYSSQAENFMVWLEQLSDMAMLEGSAYGVTTRKNGFQAVVFYNFNWYEVSSPDVFYFDDVVTLSLVTDSEENERIINSQNIRSADRPKLPDIIMHPDGYIEPEANLSLAFENYQPSFFFQQEEDGFNLLIQRNIR